MRRVWYGVWRARNTLIILADLAGVAGYNNWLCTNTISLGGVWYWVISAWNTLIILTNLVVTACYNYWLCIDTEVPGWVWYGTVTTCNTLIILSNLVVITCHNNWLYIDTLGLSRVWYRVYWAVIALVVCLTDLVGVTGYNCLSNTCCIWKIWNLSLSTCLTLTEDVPDLIVTSTWLDVTSNSLWVWNLSRWAVCTHVVCGLVLVSCTSNCISNANPLIRVWYSSWLTWVTGIPWCVNLIRLTNNCPLTNTAQIVCFLNTSCTLCIRSLTLRTLKARTIG